jgi:para-aminobenzoate synthetase component 1
LDLKETLNHFGSQKEPFFFCISYDLTQWDIVPLSQLDSSIRYSIDEEKYIKKESLKKTPISFQNYKTMFDKVQEEILNGNTYLLNLTSKTAIYTEYSLEELYEMASAKFKLYYKDKFICFSPERFIKIEDEKIYTYPMKGTIDAKLPNAKQLLLEDKKEFAEHTMVVDLLRNDLSIVSSKVKVNQFRYTDTIKAGDKELIQVSSQISGELNDDWESKIGDILTSLLPAGSITGTPKKQTVKIIDKIENYERGFFTGVFGIYDGKSLDSAVMIRFIEKDGNGKFIYKSGGGITCDSDLEKEYQEMIDKVYIP